jgi:hypothetical protein
MKRFEPQALKSHNDPPQLTRFVLIALLVGLVMHSVPGRVAICDWSPGYRTGPHGSRAPSVCAYAQEPHEPIRQTVDYYCCYEH